MNKKINKFCYIFTFITLFMLFSNFVFAKEYTPDEVLNDIINNSEVYIYSDINNDTETGVEYVLETKSNLLLDHVNNKGDVLTIGGKEYTFKMTYEDENGNPVDLADDTFIYYEDHDAFALSFSKKPSAEYNVTYSLVPKDSAESVVSSTSKLNVKTNSNNEIEPEERVVEEVKRENVFGAAWGVINLDFTRLGRLITETLCDIAIPCGDSFLHMICSSIGEQVTIDRAVYNQVNKLSIDFFEEESGETAASGSLNAPLKNVMHDLVNDFYRFFRNITILVYMVILVFIGIKMILTSTAQKKSDYKSLFMAWVMGVVMLIFFPYVMKYSIKLNNAMCEWIRSEHEKASAGEAYNGRTEASAVPPSFIKAAGTFGNDKFVMVMLNGSSAVDASDKEVEEFKNTAIRNDVFGSNVMMEIRFLAAHKLDFPLTIIYFILIGQLLAILVIYYKRVFMIAFLISIFPLVMLLYPLNKIGQVRINCFGVWFKEFLVNVFVQTFHAVTYTVIVTVGVNAYLKADNWLFMIMCVLFLFEGEKIIRAIFNVKSSMNTIGDMAAAGAMAMSITKNMTKMVPQFGKGKDSSSDDSAEEKAEKDRSKTNVTRTAGTDTMGAASNLEAAGVASGTGEAPISLGREVPVSTTEANNAMNKRMSDVSTKSFLGKTSNLAANAAGMGVSFLSQTTGATVGLTFGMAQNDSKNGLDTAVTGAASGMNAGKGVGNAGKALIGGVTGRVSRAYAGAVVAREIMDGKRDDEIDFSGADAMADKAKAEAIRKAYARVARLKGAGLDNVAEIMLIKDRLDREKNG